MLTFVGPGLHSIKPWVSAPDGRPPRFVVTGVTRDQFNATAGGCTVEIYETASSLYRGSTISDANGVYVIEIAGDSTIPLQAVAYRADNPDIGGISANTVLPTPA